MGLPLYNLEMRDMPNLDVVRSLAVLSVVVEHTLLAHRVFWLGPFQVAYFGVLGVMVFYVLTCIVLMWSLDRKPHTLDFYIRRLFRIYPLAIVTLVVARLLHAPTAGTPEHFFVYYGGSLRATALQMLLLPTVPQRGVSVMWSLPFEVAMYVLLPLLYFFVRKNFTLWPLFVLWGLAALFAHSVPPEGVNFTVAIGYFLPGVMAYIAYQKWQPRLPGALLPLWLAILWLGFWYHASFRSGWPFCLLLGLTLPLFRSIQTRWLDHSSRVIARYSYGIYLTHPFALAIAFYVLGSRPAWMQWSALAIALCVLPVAAYHTLEKPLIQLGARLAARAEDHAVYT